MTVERIVVEGLGRLPQFSHAGVAGGLVHVAGTLGTTAARGGGGLELVAGGAGPETTQTMANIGEILDAAGATWGDVAKVNVYLADMADFGAMNEAYTRFFEGGHPPARITVGGVELALGARVEIDCVAQRPAPDDRGDRPTEQDTTRSVAHDGGRVGAAAAGSPPVRRTTGFIDHDGERLYYEVVGDGGVPLVLCHGAGGNHAVWYQQVASFARDRTVVIWDHRGYGRSTDLGDRSGPEVAARDLLAVCDHLGIARADLVGQSMGGWTVAGAVLARPELARSIVLADTLGGFTSPEIAVAQAGPRRAAPAAPDDDRLGHHPAIDSVWADANPERAHLYQSLGRMGTADPSVMIGRLVGFAREIGDAARITCPVLCVVGDRDPLFAPAAIRTLAAALPDARVAELPGCGHSPYFEDPALWNAVVGRFLAEVDRHQP